MNCRLKKAMIFLSAVCLSVLLAGCEETAEDSLNTAQNLIVQGNDFKGALNVLDEALAKDESNHELIKMKDEISNYLEAKEHYYDKNYEEALNSISSKEEEVSGTVMETPYSELRERIEDQQSKSSSESHKYSKIRTYLSEADKVSPVEADFSVEQAFEIFSPHEEVSPYEDEFKSLIVLEKRTEEQEARLSEIKKTILGATTISSSVYRDSKGIFRIGCQHYLFSSTGESVNYKVYKSGEVEKVN